MKTLFRNLFSTDWAGFCAVVSGTGDLAAASATQLPQKKSPPIRACIDCSSLCQCQQPAEQALKTIGDMGCQWVDLSCLDWAPHVAVPKLVEDFDQEAARHKDGRRAMVYWGSRAFFSLNMNKLAAGATIKAVWIVPRTGRSAPAGRLPNSGVESFSTSEGWEDALLILEPNN